MPSPSAPLVPGTIITVNKIPGMVLVDGASKQIVASEGPQRTIEFQVAWDDTNAFMDGLIGVTAVAGGVGGAAIFPTFLPYPGNASLVCQSCSCEGMGVPRPDTANGQLIAFTYGRVTAMFKRPVFDVYGNDTANAFGGQPMQFAEYEIRMDSESLPLPKSVVKLPSGRPAPTRSSVEMPTKEYVLRLHYRPELPETILDPLTGTLNATTFWNKPRGTIRFLGYNMTQSVDANGTMVEVLELRFLWRRVDWNMVLDDATISFVFGGDSAGNGAYSYSDFSPILAL